MSSFLVRGRHLIPSADEESVIAEGAVLVRAGSIVEIGSYGELAKRYPQEEVIGSNEHIVMPGLVNAHHHIGLTPFQLGAPDLPLELWLIARLTARNVDPYLDTLYSAFEMIESGVTTVQHLDSLRRGPISAWPERARAVLKAYEDIGMRTSYAFGIRDQNQIVCGPDHEFVSSLPNDIRARVQDWLDGMRIDFDEYMAILYEELYPRTANNRAEKLRLWMAPTNLHWCSDELLMRCKDVASRYQAGIHIHLLETPYQKQYAQRRFSRTAVHHLHDLGFLGPEVTLGHAVWATDEDMDIIAATGTCVCHNASSNLRLRSGIAPINRMRDRGIRVAIGLDEAGINDDRDMMQELRLVKNIHREPGHDRRVPTASEVLDMATRHGAYTTGFGERIGVLEPGRGADLVLMHLRNIARPYLDDDVPIVDALIHRGRSVDVDTVIIAGEVVMKDRQFTRVDKDAVLQEIEASLGKKLSEEERERRTLSRELFPSVRRFYDDWDTPEGGSLYTPNQRD